jgi:hypothetical protein
MVLIALAVGVVLGPGLRASSLWIDWFGGGFESAVPAQLVGQVAGRDAVEASHPLLETRMVGIDVVDVDVEFAGQRFPGREPRGREFWRGLGRRP